MPDYSGGKIYRITAGDLTYIGSTTQSTLARRLASHVGCYRFWKNGKGHFVSSFPLIETGQYKITLIELFPCGSKDELSARERFHIESNDCVNKVIPGRTREEVIEYQKTYREVNKDKNAEQRKVYYNVHNDKILEEKKIYYETNAVIIREKQKTYRETNADALQDYHNAYRLSNRDKINQRQREARAKKKSEAIP